jgi:hypothetical protein
MKKEHMEVLLEDINAKFDTVLENIIPDIRDIKAHIVVIEQTITDIKAENAAHKAWLWDHEGRIKVLETA